MSNWQFIITGAIATILVATLLTMDSAGALDYAAPAVVVLTLVLSALHHHNQKGIYTTKN